MDIIILLPIKDTKFFPSPLWNFKIWKIHMLQKTIEHFEVLKRKTITAEMMEKKIPLSWIEFKNRLILVISYSSINVLVILNIKQFLLK